MKPGGTVNYNIPALKVLCLLIALALPAMSEARKKSASSVRYPIVSGEPIRQVVNHTSYDVHITPGRENRVDVTGSEEAMRDARISVSDGILRIQYSTNTRNVEGNLKINVTGDEVNSIVLMGSGEITAVKLDSRAVNIGVYGSGSVRVNDLTAIKSQILLQGSGDVIVVNSNVTYSGMTLQGSGDILVKKAEGVSVECMLQGSGDINVQNIEATSVKAYCQGSGDIMLSGKAKSSSLVNQGTGDIHASRLKTQRSKIVNQGTGDIL